jgi:hypothetical protein
VPKSVKDFLVEYGAIGLVIYLITTALVYVGFWFAREVMPDAAGGAGKAGYWLAAYGVAKATQPFRILGSAAITPFVARIYERVTGRRSGPTPTA